MSPDPSIGPTKSESSSIPFANSSDAARRTSLSLERSEERNSSQFDSEIRLRGDQSIGDESNRSSFVSREVGVDNRDTRKSIERSEADLLGEGDVAEDRTESGNSNGVGSDLRRRRSARDHAGTTRVRTVHSNPGLRRMNVAKSVNRARFLIVRTPVVSRFGTPLPPEEQMGGRAIVAISEPCQMTVTPSGNSMSASKAENKGKSVSTRSSNRLRERTSTVEKMHSQQE